MIQVGDLVKHKHIGGLGLVKRAWTVDQTNVAEPKKVRQAKINGLSTPMRVVDTPSFGQNYSKNRREND